MREEYEAVFIFKEYKNENKIKQLKKKIDEIIIDEKCEIFNKNDLGTRRLAYKIKNKTVGYYYVVNFKTSVKKKNTERRIKMKLNTMEEILKYLIIRIDK